MQLEIVVTALKSRCPSFSNRVAGAAQFKHLPENQTLPVPAAYVVPLDDQPSAGRAQNSVRQPLTDSFAVIVALSNVADEKGQGAAHTVNSLRAELWAALLGWRPAERYNGINYEGGQLLAMDRARLWYQFEFGAEMELCPDDGWQDRELAGLGNLEGVDLRVDAIEPSDPNRVPTPQPDGRIEAGADVPKGGVWP